MGGGSEPRPWWLTLTGAPPLDGRFGRVGQALTRSWRRDWPAPSRREPGYLAAALGLGVAVGAAWPILAAPGRTHSTVWNVVFAGWLALAIPAGRRRRLDRLILLWTLWILFRGGVSLVVSVEQIISGGHTFRHPGRVVIGAMVGIVFFGGGRLLVVRLRGPNRRLSDELARRASVAAGDRGLPVQLVLRDGRRVQAIVMHHRYIAGAMLGYTAQDVTDVVPITNGAP